MMTPAERQELRGVLAERAARVRARRGMGGAPSLGPNGEYPPGYGPRPGETMCDYRRRIGSPLVMFTEGCGAMGDASSDLRSMPLPPALDRYLKTGTPMSSFRRDLGAATAQVPWWAYGAGALIAFWMGWKAYKRHTEERGR